MTITEFQKKVSALDIKKILDVVLELPEIQDALIELQKAQLEVGKTSLGGNIDPEYQSDKYADLKMDLGSKAPYGTPNLFLEGNFSEDIDIIFNPNTLELFSTDEKNEKLVDKYADIFGLTPENFKIWVRREVLPELQDEIKRRLN